MRKFAITLAALGALSLYGCNNTQSTSPTTSPLAKTQSTADFKDYATSAALTHEMGLGWNLGNTLEAVGGETAWGNPKASRELINAVHAAGFKTIRIPVAWSQFSDEKNFTIKQEWLDRVEEVVGYALDADMYVLLNMHWDGGWMQPTYAAQDYANQRMSVMWTQIAERFKHYDERLLFAGTNEVMVTGDYGTPTKEYYTVQNGFNQKFVDTVRKTAGNNPKRYLIVQGFNTNIDHTLAFAVMPQDTINNRLLMEVHYYDPYEFVLDEKTGKTQWGKRTTDKSKAAGWGNEDHANKQFARMKEAYVDNGIGVILGEFGAIRREIDPAHEAFRIDWNREITRAALKHQLVPVYWDNGDKDDLGFALFDRDTNKITFPDVLDAIVNSD